MRDISERYGSAAFCAAYITGAVALSHLAGVLLPGRWWLPVLNGGLFFLLYQGPLRAGEYKAAIRLAGFWAALTVVVQVLLTLLFPQVMERVVWHGAEYRYEMLTWIRTGAGAEGDITLYLPVHARHFVVFCVLSLISGGLFGLVMGAAMLGYMNFYVGELIRATGGSWTALLLGWQVWALVRVAGYIVAGTALGAVFMHRPEDLLEKRSRVLKLMGTALALVVLDVVLKWALAGSYQKWLHAAMTAAS